MKAMVLAAGVGSRLEPLTTQVPKPLVPVANIPVMHHMLELLASHGFTDVCANLHYLPEQITRYFGDGSQFGINLYFKYEEKLSGDAGGVRSCREFLQDETFLVIMGDLLTDADLTAIIRQHKHRKALASIAIRTMDDVSHFGVLVTDQNGFVTGFQEKPKREEALSNYISTGIYVLEPEIFDHIPELGEFGFGRQLFPSLVQKRLPVLGVEIEGYWSDVGTLRQYRQTNFDALTRSVQLNLPQEVQRSGLTLWKDESAQIDQGSTLSGRIMLGKNSCVRSGATLSGTVVIGDNVIVESGAHIIDSVIWSGCRIGTKAQITNSVIGLNYSIKSGTEHMEVAVRRSISTGRLCLAEAWLVGTWL